MEMEETSPFAPQNLLHNFMIDVFKAWIVRTRMLPWAMPAGCPALQESNKQGEGQAPPRCQLILILN